MVLLFWGPCLFLIVLESVYLLLFIVIVVVHYVIVCLFVVFYVFMLGWFTCVCIFFGGGSYGLC